MSATTSMGPRPVFYSKVISGVCADLAERAGLPVWLPRTVFVVFAVMHWLLALILYFGLSWVIGPRPRGMASGYAAPRPVPCPEYGTMRSRFSALDERLTNLEAATIRSESELRRAFRDLERK